MPRYPDNQGRDNTASKALMAAIDKGKADMRLFFNASDGQVFVGESGTEVLFRLIRTAALGAAPGGIMLSTTLEHPASRERHGALGEVTGRTAHCWCRMTTRPAMSALKPTAAYITPDVRVATIIHTSPVTGMAVDVAAIAAAIRKASRPTASSSSTASSTPATARSTSPPTPSMAMRSRPTRCSRAMAMASAGRRTGSPRCTKETVMGGTATNWEMGTRDAGSYATFSDVGRLPRLARRAYAVERRPPPRLEAAAMRHP